MSHTTPVLCTDRVRSGFVALLHRHWPTMRALDLVTDDHARAPKRAHELPELMAIWEQIGPLCESRGGLPNMELPHVRPVAMPFAQA